MSEAVTDSDIEDVLSSIRRLISATPGEDEKTARPDPVPGKLVLTPDFRVGDGGAETTDAPADPAQTDRAAPTPKTPAPEDSGDSLEARIAELEAAIGNIPEEWEPDGSEAPGKGPELVVLHPETAAADGEAGFVEAGEGSADIPADIVAFSATGITLEAEEVTGDTAGTRTETETRTEARTGADDNPAADAAQERPGEQGPAEDELVIDEDTLRELVSQLVRAELKGRIGERITRNIRRMVRREIKLALSVREID